jgi:hypothetical protein
MFFCVVTPCRLVGRYQRFRETSCFHLQGSETMFWVVTRCGLVGRFKSFGETYCIHLQGSETILFWVATWCGHAGRYRRFEESYSLHLQGSRTEHTVFIFRSPKMETLCYSEASLCTYDCKTQINKIVTDVAFPKMQQWTAVCGSW